MRLFPIPLLSHVRVLVRRAPSSSRMYAVPALAYTNSTISHSEQSKEGNFDVNSLELNEVGVLRVLTTMRDDPYLALSFLKRIEGNGDSLPSVSAYAAVIRIVCSWSLDEKLSSLFVGIIRKGDEGRGFSVVDLLNAVGDAEEDEKLSFLLRSRVSSALVKAYAEVEMFDEAIHLFWGIDQLRWDADADTYVVVVQALYRKGDGEGVEKFHSKLLSSETRKHCGFYMDFIEGLCVNEMSLVGYILLRPLRDANILVDESDLATAYGKVVKGLCNEMKLEEAESALHDMEECGIDPDVSVYSAVVEGHRKNMSFSKALRFVNDKVAQKGERIINPVIASSMLQCWCQMGKFSEALDQVVAFRNLNITLDRFCYNVAFDALIKLGRVDEAVELFREMTCEGIDPDVVNYTTLIGGCCQHGRCGQAIDLIMEMESKGKPPDIVVYNVLAGGLARNAENAYGVLKLMEDRGVKPTSVTHSMVIQGLIVAGKIDEAEALYQSLEEDKPGGNVAGGIVKGYCEAGRLDEAFERFIRLDFPLPKNVYFTLFASLCAAKDIDKAQKLVERMWELGVEPVKSMYGKLIGAWCRVGDVRKAIRFLKVLKGREIVPDLFTYTIMIKTCCRLNKLKQADALFRDMKKRGIRPDVVTYTVLAKNNPEEIDTDMKTCGIVPDVATYTALINSYYRLNNRKKAYDLFLEMKRRRICPDVVTYTVLLNHDPKLDVKREMRDLRIKRDVHYYTVLIHHKCKTGEVEEAERIFREMKESGVEPDVVSYRAIIAGCLRNGYVRDAKRFFQEMREKGIEPPPAEASKNVVLLHTKSNTERRVSRTKIQEALY
ncbi:BnaC05g10140D [Brassica napus]|uniref:BnaC05g10140D protein n=1 Tax=Brassica napus TaxID=3708 RepID=A0A078HI02_BRANA|nr:BnaC05g10140D [Brassica napus]